MALLLELALQRGTLKDLLDGVLLLLNVWNRSQRERDNREKVQLGAAPLLPVLRRLEERIAILCDKELVSEVLSVTEVFSENLFSVFPAC